MRPEHNPGERPALLEELEPATRRVLLLASMVLFFETIFFTALAPLLPHYEESFDISKSGAGILTAAYAAGAFIGAVPAGLLTLRWGVRTAVLLGLVLLAVGSLAFGFANSVSTLNGARCIQGIGSSMAWTGALTWLVTVAPRSRRGEVLGIALGAAVGGSLAGPAVGAIAVRIGTEATFSFIGCLGLFLIGLACSTPPPRPVADRLRSMIQALQNGAAAAGAYLLLFSALLLGAWSVLAPLQLDDLGWSAGEIAGLFLASSAITMLFTPRLGKWSDRHGRVPLILAALVLSSLVSLGLAVTARPLTFALFIVAAGVAFSSTWVPGTALLSDGTERAGIGLAIGFVLFNLAWTPGFLAGAAAGGWLASATSNSVAYFSLAAVCVTTLVGALFLGVRNR